MVILKRAYLTALALLPLLVHAQDHIPITGLRTAIGDDGWRPARLNINYMQDLGGPQWDLYILGLRQMQQLDQSDPESFFQIAGIHGRPYISWNGAERGPHTEETGYCFHNEIPFITWHRPYVALYEQTLGRIIQDIALKYTGDEASSYTSAAESFRIPFWDWAIDSNLPPATTWPKITVNTPDGETTIPNPLYSFRWPNFPLNHDPEWFPTHDSPIFWNYTGTQRLIDGNNSSGDLSLNVGALQDKVYSVLSKTKDFDLMASTSSRGPSFEDPHNDIHQAAGKFMTNPVYSSFDPIFWLHHSNVDRLFALWQAINYNSTYQSGPANITGGTYAQASGTQMTADDPLAPFYQADGETPHTGRSVASTEAFGYTYPEINDWSLSPVRTRQVVIWHVNQLYGPNQAQAHPRSRGSWRRAPRRCRRGSGNERQYYAQIGVERAELDLPCTINILLGDHVVAGSMAIMAAPRRGRTNSEIQLNRGIGQIRGCVSDEEVVPMLEQKLRVEIRKGDGTLVPLETVPSLTVDIESVDVRLSGSDDELPNYGMLTRYAKIGRPSNGYQLPAEEGEKSGYFRRGLMAMRAYLGW